MYTNESVNKGWTYYVDSESDIEKLPTNTKKGTNGNDWREIFRVRLGQTQL